MEQLEPLYDIYNVNNWEKIDPSKQFEIIIPIRYLSQINDLDFIDIGESNYFNREKLFNLLDRLNFGFKLTDFKDELFTAIYIDDYLEIDNRLQINYAINKVDKPTLILN